MLSHLRSGSKRTKAIWLIVTIATVFTFLIGFSFIGSMGRDPSMSARQSGAYGEIDGQKVTREMWNGALASAKENFKQRFGSEPVDRDLKSVEQQAWRNLVSQQLLARQASKAGLKATDNDVIVGMRTNPPSIIYTAPAFQTDGKFDPQKYQAALRNPNIDWSPFEAQVREEMPVRKLQERLMSSLKLSEGELREAWRDRYERMSAVVVQVPPADSGSSPGSDAELQRMFEKYRTRMSTPARTELEVLALPIRYSPDEVKAAMETAKGLYERARKGEDWDQLVKDYSEGPNADHGGLVPRFMNPMELGPIGQTIAAHQPGDVLDPYRENGQVMIFRIVDPKSDSTAKPPYPGAVKLAQLVIKLRAGSESLRAQYQEAKHLAERAKSVGLGRAATEKGLATAKTGFFDMNNMPQQLYAAPEASDWGMSHRKGEVSQVFQGSDEFLIAQVAAQHAAGAPAKDEVADQLKPIADVEHRVELAKSRADQVGAAVRSGAKLEEAASRVGLTSFAVSMTRAQADPRVNAMPEVQGALWGAKPGQTVGPIRTPGGWFFGRVDVVSTPSDSLWNDQVKGQITTDILSRRQRAFFDGYIAELRQKAKIQDSRSAFTGN